jgi:hypothetical protein
MAIDKPIVATTIGIIPYLNKGSTKPRLNNQPKTKTDKTQLTQKLTNKGMPASKHPIIMNAGNMTNSPWAKLIVPEACQSNVKPKAANE